MGSSQSKTSAAPRTFLPQTSVQFSQDLVETLEDIPESDFTRATENFLKIESSVSKELSKIQSETSALLTQAWSKTDSPSSSTSPSLTTSATLEEIAALKANLSARLQKIENKAELGKKADFERPRLALIACLKKNDAKPLVCLDEFNAFKDKLESTIN
ncbi:hypothetical protein BZA70DRAFT_186434 [Myxozyma melibiosi]|uniref:DUF1690 domain-containing protein n=1 Tax=Myxozyma melibiosi TaxID=54550 RepID=A0ABR1F4X9_9ASCO